MVMKSNESTFRNPRVVEKFSSSFEKNSAGSSQKSGTDSGQRFSRNSAVQEPQSPEDLRYIKGSTSVSQSSVASWKKDQWNAKRDIPVGTVRNNPFLPEPKQQPPPSPQLKYQKKQWDTSNIRKGSVAARIQESNSPSNKNGGNRPISPAKVMGRPKAFSSSSSGYSHPYSKDSVRSDNIAPRGFFPKGFSPSAQINQKSFVKSPDKTSTQQQTINDGKEKVATKKGWEPSREIPTGTVKGRLSSLYGGQSASKGMKVKDISTPVSITPKKFDRQSSVVEESTKTTENSNEYEDQWIIPERKGANIQVFASDWGEAIPAKSSESDDWDTPAKDWIRSGESQTQASSSKEMQQNSSEKRVSLPAEIAAPMPDESKPKISASSILPPPPKDASSYHKPRSQKSKEDTFFDPKSPLSQVFSNNFESFSTKSEMDSIDKSKTVFSEAHDINQQLISGSSDAFGFPISSTLEVVENQNIGEVVSGDEFFDASVLPEDYGQPSSNTQGFDVSAPLDGNSQPRSYDPGFDVSTPPNDYDRPATDLARVDASPSPTDVQPESKEQPNGYGCPTRDELGLDASVQDSFGQPSSSDLGYNLNRYPSMTSASSIDDEAYSSMNDLKSGKGDSKKKKKGFLKGLFGRKNKGNGKVKQSKDNRNRKERSHSKTGLSDSMTNSSEVSRGLVTMERMPGKQLSKSNEKDPVQTNQFLPIPTIGTSANHHSIEEHTLPNESHDSKGFSTQNDEYEESVDPKNSIAGDLNEFKAASLIRSSVVRDDIFDGLEKDIPSSQNSKKTTVEEFLDPELDHLDSNIDSDEESNLETTVPSKTNIHASPDKILTAERCSDTNEMSNMHSHNSTIEKSSSPRKIAEPNSPEKAAIQSSRPKFSHPFMSQRKETSNEKIVDATVVSSKPTPQSRSYVPVRQQQSLLTDNDSTLGSNFPRKRYTKSAAFNRASSVNDAVRQDAWHSGKQPKESTYGRHKRPSKTDLESQTAREKMKGSNHDGAHSKKFSRAAHAYNSSIKKNKSEEAEDQRKYLSIPAASTSASDISCSSTYDTYQKKLAESLKKSNILTKNSSEYSLYSNKSLDDSSIESDIRVLRSILRRPRLDHSNERTIKASRQIQGFPTYDTESATDPMQRLGMRLLSAAIIPIQTEVRRFLAMRRALTRMWALIVIQAHTRRFLARKKFHTAVDAAITIQSVLRGHLARNDVIDKHICAIEIQRHVRGYLATMQVYEDIYKVTLIQSLVRMRIAMDYAAYRMSLIIQLQAIARGFLERRRHAHRNKCATLIQSSWRCFYNRLNYQFDLLDIIIIQSLWRKKLGVRVAERKIEEKRNMAATIIQAEWRAYDCRMDFLCYTSARTIQARWRSYICQKNYVEYQASTTIQSAARMLICRLQYIDYQAAVTIQSLARMYFCRTDYTHYKCARKIQSIGRMYLCRYDYLEYRAATTLQSAVRMFLCRSGYVEYQSATKIQSVARMYLCRYDYLEYNAATTLQSAIRMFLCKSDYAKYRAEIAATVIQAKWRSYDCSSMYERYRAARTIQKMWRSYDCQMNYLHFLADILIVQSTIRRFLVQRKVKALKNDAATVIQRAWRGFVCYADYEEFKAARKIQSAWRGLVCYIDYHEHLTVRRIQSVWRGYYCRREYKRERAAIVIQKTWRGFLFYADYMFELSDIVVVQKQIRGWLAKRVADKRRHEVRNIAAITLQKHWRRVVDENRYGIIKQEKRASTIIQTNWRRFWCFSNFVIALDCSIQIQAQMRGYIQRKDYLSKKYAVRVIETAWRNAQAKKLTSQLSVIHQITHSGRDLANRESSAAIKLQRVFRGSLCRSALKVYLAAVLIQSRVRGQQARVAVGLFMSARKIQAAWRAFAPRQSYITYIAARKIQTTWRSYIPRQSYVTYIAARCIQNNWRCKKANQEVFVLRKEYSAATSIQSAWRGFVSYTDFVFTLSDIVAAQRIARGYLSRKKYAGIIRSNTEKMKTRRNGAIAIQRVFRGFQARQNYWYTLGCTMQIQSWWRGRRVYRRIQKEANAISTLQCFARCCLARQEYMQRRFVFMLIQTAEVERSKKIKGLRSKEQRQEYMERQQEDKAARVIQRFYSDVDHDKASQLVQATKRRKEWREEMKKEKYTDNVEDTMLEDIWTGIVAKSDFVDEPFTRHYDDFSKLAGPAIPLSPHPTSSIRMIRKVDATDMDDDFQLEEAFIDAAICHAKERRNFAGSDRGRKVYPPPGSSRGGAKSTRKESTMMVSPGKKKRSESIDRDKNKSRGNVLAMMSNH